MVLLRQKLTSKKIQKTKLIYLIVLWTAFLAVLLSALLLYFLKVPKPIFTTISLFLVLVFFILVLVFKTKIAALNLKQKYFRLKETKVQPFLVKKTFFEKLPDSLQASNFKLQSSTLDFNLYINENTQNRGLELTFYLKNPNIGFLDTKIDAEIKKVLKRFEQKRIAYFTCLIFKKYSEHSAHAELETDNLVFLKNHGFNFTSVNIAYFEKESTLYFLHSKSFYPTTYFKAATETILKLTN